MSRVGRKGIALIWVFCYVRCLLELDMMLTASLVLLLRRLQQRIKHWWTVISCQIWSNLMKMRILRKSSTLIRTFSPKELHTHLSIKPQLKMRRKPRKNWQPKHWLLMMTSLMSWLRIFILARGCIVGCYFERGSVMFLRTCSLNHQLARYTTSRIVLISLLTPSSTIKTSSSTPSPSTR